MRNVIFTAIFIMAILGVLRKAGALDALLRRLMRFATAGNAKPAIFSLVAFMCPFGASNAPAMLFTGPVVKEIGDRFQIHRTRRRYGCLSCATGAPLVPLTTIGLLATP